ncbi:MAG TPA: cation:proton antiporter, partial [Vicinamibacterales bacterium]|nr:cation:proton antiporter [Vicinamibacterales bacterium]
MIVLPEVSKPSADIMRVVLATGRALLVLAVTVLVATRIVPRLMALVARWNSRELFLVATTTVALGVGYAEWSFGLSMALGAFIAGLVINESEYAHQALSDIIPLRDIFGLLFFVSVGMLLDPAVVWKHFGTVAIVVGSVAVGKAAIFAAIVRLFGYRRVVPLAVGLTLFQVGEFAFVLARVGLAGGAISSELYSLVLNTAVATMALTPIVSGTTSRIYQRLRRETSEPLQTTNVPATGLSDHIVIAGAGRVGRTIADALGSQNLPSVLIELDARHFQQAREAGLAAIYGDASQAVVLEAAHLSRASTLLVTVPTYSDVRAIVKAARQLRPDITIVARADGPDAVRELYAVGIDDVTSPEFEAAIEMTREALVRLAVPADDIRRLTTTMRRERYRGE